MKKKVDFKENRKISENLFLSEKKSDEKFVKTRAQWHENWNFTLAPVTCEQNQREMKRRKKNLYDKSSSMRKRRSWNELKCRKKIRKEKKFLFFQFLTIIIVFCIRKAWKRKTLLNSLSNLTEKCFLIWICHLMNWFNSICRQMPNNLCTKSNF